MQFFTATINSWQKLLADDRFKDIIVDSLEWFHTQNRAAINGFIIMPNHIHLLWTSLGNIDAPQNENALIKFTAHEFKKIMIRTNDKRLNDYISTQHDREFHFWERRSRTIDVMSRKIAEQKLDYMHANPLQARWNLVSRAEDYSYSSARYYLLNKASFTFLKHYMDCI